MWTYMFSADILNLFCRPPPLNILPTVLENLKVSTVMKCKEKNRCSLYLNIKGTVTIDAHIRGVEICTTALSTSQNLCTSVRFSRNKIKNMPKIHIQYNCFEVGVAQQVYVTMKTIPYFCNVELARQYTVEDCQNQDVGKNVLSCLTGKLDYMVDEEKKVITVHVSDILKDFNYNVRLCLKHFTCQDTGAFAQIKKEDVAKSASLPYSEIVPCLCIEGWSAFPDSRRIRLCPFKNGGGLLHVPVNFNSSELCN
ncbi:putative interleukin-17 receptor E-like isoform X2 [Bombina bombina]|uniref:putative interleukin-17 receptor E-like isoform X2 n=1 Tax=Bombina bombina TaxID=8345 RepID=UPI00235B189D|nr:putative interleukin-17 receptor E-like isoform X2 [Bombina bombina]